jgi:DNA-binding response OmpR family regulator
MMTARGEERTIRTALDAGADDFLYKPFEDIQIELGIAAARRVGRVAAATGTPQPPPRRGP